MDLGSSLTHSPWISFFLGAASTYVFLKYRAYISDRGAQISDHIKDIENLSSAAVELWSMNKGTFQKASEVQLLHTLSVHVYGDVKHACHARKSEYEELMFELFDAASADDFQFEDPNHESMNEVARQERIQGIISTSSSLIFLLRRIRSDVSTFGYLLREMWMKLQEIVDWIERDCLSP